MLNLIGKKVLVTTVNWFFAPDGMEYRAVFGTLKGVHEAGKTLGFIPNRSHANWFIEVGNMNIMGCQVMYVVETNICHTDRVPDWKLNDTDGKVLEFERPTKIYNADPVEDEVIHDRHDRFLHVPLVKIGSLPSGKDTIIGSPVNGAIRVKEIITCYQSSIEGYTIVELRGKPNVGVAMDVVQFVLELMFIDRLSTGRRAP